MNTTPSSPDDRLRAALRAARPAPSLPPRFQEAVWRRIEQNEIRSRHAAFWPWLDVVAAWLLRPRLALAGATAMLLVGIGIGIAQGSSLATDRAKQQYLSAVSPLTSR